MAAFPHSDTSNPYSKPMDGHLYLGEAIRWIASEGGIRDSGATAEHWAGAERALFAALGSGALTADGANPQGLYVPIPQGHWPLATSDYASGRPIVTYPDEIGGTFSGTLEV